MNYRKQLGIFAKDPVAGEVKTRLVPPLEAGEACDVYSAFLSDLFMRTNKLKKMATTVFYAGESDGALRAILPKRYNIEPQCDGDLGLRMHDAFERMLRGGTPGAAVLIGSDSPDIPLPYIKRAFVRLKHKDIVLGPAVDGGYYLIGLRRPLREVFDGVNWGESTVFEETLDRVRALGLSLALLPVWYDVDTVEALAFLDMMLRARRVEGTAGLPNVSRVLDGLRGRIEIGS